ncbi:hypothetical protein [Klebsiella variicola]|uniref:hypothetical protein n=1 Tax=Klebsiella variicola TaxID=244366 RepID=UPI00190D09DD|nr:hypothetical protein [Klebsiella variicola]
MTDITELALREKFEAWVITQICISKSTLEGLRTSDGYRNSTLSGRDYNLMWNLWKAAGAELVEALEKAQQERDNWRTSFDNERFRADKLKAHIDEMTEERTASINELSRIIQKEVKAKREAEQCIAELESRTVTVKLTDINEYLAEVHDKTLNRALRLLAEGVRAGDVAAMRAAGIKVEAE